MSQQRISPSQPQPPAFETRERIKTEPKPPISAAEAAKILRYFPFKMFGKKRA